MKLAAVLAAALALPSSPLHERFAALASKGGGVAGVFVVEAATGRAAGLAENERFPMCSTYKFPIALALLHRVDEGALLLSERVEVEEGDVVEGGMETLLRMWKPGLTLTVKELLDLMVTESDNIATEVLFRRLGGPPAVAARLKELGVKDMDVSRTEKQIAADASGITLPRGPVSAKAFRELVKKVPAKDRQAARLAFEKDPRDTTTPRAMAELLVRFTKGELLSKDSTELLRDALRRCKTGDKRIRALLPPGTLVFDKTGTAARCTNDVGLVRLPDGRELAVAVYVKSSPKPPETRERTIAELARAAYQEFASPRAAAVITRRRSASV